MQIQRAQPASLPSTHRAGTEPAAGQGHCRYRADSDSTRPQGSLTSLWATMQAPKGDLKTKLVSSTPNRSVETVSGPFLLIPPIPPACSQIPSLSASEPVVCSTQWISALQTSLSHWQPPSPAWSDPAGAARLQLLSWDWHCPPPSPDLPACGTMGISEAAVGLFLQVLLQSVAALLTE